MSRYNRNIPSLKDEAARSIRDIMAKDAARRKSFVPEDPLLIFTDKMEGFLDPYKEKRFKLEASEHNQWIEVRARTSEGVLLLATHLYRYDEVLENGKKRKYSTLLEGGQKINFITYLAANAEGEKRPLIDISYHETKIFRALLLFWKRLKNKLSDLMGAYEEHPVLVLARAIITPRVAYPLALALFCVALAVPMQYLLFPSPKPEPTVAQNNLPADVAKTDDALKDSDGTANAPQPSPSPDTNRSAVQSAGVPASAILDNTPRGRSNIAKIRSARPAQPERQAAMLLSVLRTELSTSASGGASLMVTGPTPAALEPATNGEETGQVISGGEDTTPLIVITGMEGEVLNRSADSFVLITRDRSPMTFKLTDRTKVSAGASSLLGTAKYPMTRLLPGARVEVQAEMADAGEFVAQAISISKPSLSTNVRVADQSTPPIRLNKMSSGASAVGLDYGLRTTSQENMGAPVTGLFEVMKVEGLASGQATNDQTLKRVGVSLATPGLEPRPYILKETVIVPFSDESAELSPEATGGLDKVSQKVDREQDYMIHVVGFAAPQINAETTRGLIEQRTDAVVENLMDNQKIPLRRIIVPQVESPAPQGIPQLSTAEASRDRVEVIILQR